MGALLSRLYDRIVLEKPMVSLLFIAALAGFFGAYVQDFKLDASAESLVLENDDSLKYFRAITKKYSSDDFLVITYSPKDDLMSEQSLGGLRALRNDLLKMERVKDVVTILNVPLINSPKVEVSELAEGVRNLETPGMDKELARREFLESPIYKNLLVSPDGKTTAIQVIFKRDEKYFSLLHKRNDLREKKKAVDLTEEESREYQKVFKEFREYHTQVLKYQNHDIMEVRRIMDQYRDRAEMFLGGVPMIVSDMIAFIKHDLEVFGLGVLAFLILTLTFFFRHFRYVFLPLLCCTTTALVMTGFLGYMDWRVTVISSNFISILLIITMSLTIHLIVRYRDLHVESPDMDQRAMVLKAVHDMALPCFYTSLTTVVAFCSLVVSDIRPVIDFGWIMTIGISLAYVLNFIFFPAAMVFLKPGRPGSDTDPTKKLTLRVADFTITHKKKILATSVLLAILSGVGISRLEVENRFIDNFDSDTEIYQGMEVIDKQLGGTTPLDVVIDPDDKFREYVKEMMAVEAQYGDEGVENMEDYYNYWFNVDMLNRMEKVHDYLESLPEVGKVQSLSSAIKAFKVVNDGQMPDDYELAIIRKKLPEDAKKTLVAPYISEDANQARITMRLIDSDPNLRRQALLEKIKDHLVNVMHFKPEQVRLTGMVVLYNNMLQSLYRSQILTIGVVFIGILLMFVILFRSVNLAVLGIIPNLLSAAVVLGLMGLAGIPLDMMTITIAAITIGIAVDDTIHYIHCFKREFPVDRDYLAAVGRCHGSIGKAIYYTSVTITMGFSILAISQFTPTIYFGLLTGLAMVVALLGVLTLLPLLLLLFKPLGPENAR